MTEFDICEITAFREGGIMTLALRGTAGGRNTHLILTLDGKPTEQDVALGQDGVHAEWDDQACGGYGLIRSAQWIGPDLTIAITDAGRELGMPGTIMLRSAVHHLDGEGRAIANAMMIVRGSTNP